MRKVCGVGAVLLLASMVSTANAQFQYFENFENGLTGWNLWTERGTNNSAAAQEAPDLGNVVPQSGANDTMAYVGGQSFNGGIWQVINLSEGPGTYTIDGYWRSAYSGSNNHWAEVIIKEGNAPPTNGSDTTGPLHYKDDNFGGTDPWNGQISVTSDQAGGATGGSFTTASGTITLILTSGTAARTTVRIMMTSGSRPNRRAL